MQVIFVAAAGAPHLLAKSRFFERLGLQMWVFEPFMVQNPSGVKTGK